MKRSLLPRISVYGSAMRTFSVRFLSKKYVMDEINPLTNDFEKESFPEEW